MGAVVYGLWAVVLSTLMKVIMVANQHESEMCDPGLSLASHSGPCGPL